MVRMPRKGRAEPGSRGSGEFYHIVVRPKGRFATFRTHAVGRYSRRVAGKRASGSWDTVKWLIRKEDAHAEKGKLVADTPGARKILKQLGSAARQTKGDRFEAKPRRNVPEKEKPTAAQRRAQRRNIRNAQRTRRKAR